MRTLITGKALEINTTEKKDDPSVLYHKLIVFEPGKAYPELLKITVPSAQLPTVYALVGNDVIIEAEITVYSSGKISMTFVNGKVAPVKAAA